MSQSSSGIREVGFLDCAGGGQVVVDGNYAYIGHITGPEGTTIADVSDPKHPRTVWECSVPEGTHSHKVRAANGIMLTNHELDPVFRGGDQPDVRGGLGIYDVSNPTQPREVTFWDCPGTGIHRFTFDGRYAYLSPCMEGYRNNIVVILDLADPEKPQEVGRWWMPGQWVAGGEEPGWTIRGPKEPRCHHPIRLGDRLYVSYWHAGGFILDISDMAHPTLISSINWSPPFPWPMHSLVPVPFDVYGHRWMIVADEDVLPKDTEEPPQMPAALWMVNITEETNPVTVSSYQVDGVAGHRNPLQTGCHQPVETIRGNEVPVAWFAQGLRVLDISNPHQLREVAHYVPEPAGREPRVSSNDVYQDDRGLIYLIDRVEGLHILERS